MEEYGKRNTSELKKECAKRKLSTAGKKIPLVKRLVEDDIQKRDAHLANAQSLAFNRSNDPDGTKRRQFIEQEYAFKRAALYVVTEAEIDYYSNLVEQARADRKSGEKTLMAERIQALLAVDESLNTYPKAMEKVQNDQAMDVDSAENGSAPVSIKLPQKRPISPSEDDNTSAV